MNNSNEYNELLKKFNAIAAQNALLLQKIDVSNDVYKRVFDNSNDIISLVDKNYTFILVNHAFLKNHNVKKEDVIGKSIAEIIGNNNFENIVKPYLNRCLIGETIVYQEWFKTSNFKPKFLDINYSPFFDENKEISGVLISSRDITNNKITEINLSELSCIVEQSNEAVIKTDNSFRIIYMNKAAENLYGWKFEEIKQKTPIFLAAEKNIGALKRNIVFNIKQNGNISSVALNKTKTGEVFYCEFKITVIYNENKKIAGFVGFVRDITEKIVAEQKIKHEHEYLQNLISSMRDLVFVFDKNGIFVDYNKPNYEQKLFSNPKEFLYKHYSKVMPKSVSDKIYNAIAELKKGKNLVVFDYSLSKNNKTEYFNTLFSKLVDDNSNYNGTIAVVRNITDKIIAQKKLKISEQKYKSLVNNSPDVIYKYSKIKGTLYCSNAVFDVLGYTQQELYDKPFLWTNSIVEEYQELVNNAIEKYKSGQKNEIIYQIKDKNGNTKWLSDVFTRKINNDNQIIIEGHASDITGYKNAELEIIERQNFINSILDNMPSAVFVHDDSGKFIIVNKKAEQTLGFSKHELLSMNITDIDVDNESHSHLVTIWEKLQKLKSINFETNHRRKNNTTFPVEMFISSIIINNQKYLLCIANDITDRKNAENKLFENEQKL
ncbi:MAG: PAS domain S-box protein, partial [Bacteroidales bacterium]|nr:PAS domain S-box protein [Bacteroidales bacterium]